MGGLIRHASPEGRRGENGKNGFQRRLYAATAQQLRGTRLVGNCPVITTMPGARYRVLLLRRSVLRVTM